MSQVPNVTRCTLGAVVLTCALASMAFADDTVPARVAMLPLANHTSRPELVDLFTPLVTEQLRAHGKTPVTVAELRPVLRRFRIRAVGSIDAAGARQLGEATGADYLLLGSVDLFNEGAVPEAAISLRLLHAASMRIVWAASAAATGEDQVTVLDLGRVTDQGELARRLVIDAFDGFDARLAGFYPDSLPHSRLTTALIPFDDLDLKSQAGAALTHVILAALVNRGVEVCEPGEVAALLQRHRKVFRGEIDLPRLRVLHDSLHVDAVITGYLQECEFGVASVASATPHLEVGARLIDAGTGRVLRVVERTHDGADSEHLFGRGITHALGKLMQVAAADVLKAFGYDRYFSTLGKN